ncbi:MAG: sugar phosphate nucleotidyltransferase [Spirochaetia bacterium]|nr:sugar phosphate nucleotidyltransferase [Spirochaetia bacterium]
MNIKCLIPAAGKGTRMRPLTHSLPKAMLPVAGKPAIFHIIDSVKETGITDFVIITGYLYELMESEILNNYPELKIEFVRQTQQKGLGHACYMAKDKFENNEGLLIIYGDTLFDANLKEIIESKNIVIGVCEVEDPRRFGVVELDENKKKIINLIEKPKNPPTNLAIPGINYFPNSRLLFDALENIIKNNIKTKNEYQITDAFSHIVKNNISDINPYIIDNWYDVGTLDEMLNTNKLLLIKNETENLGIIENSKIIDPVYIEKGAIIKNSSIGPCASIAANVQVINSNISSSIIDINSEITSARIQNSIIGRNSKIKEINGKIIVGDDCVIENKNNST